MLSLKTYSKHATFLAASGAEDAKEFNITQVGKAPQIFLVENLCLRLVR